ncbi:MAG TPA: hypothetical protein VF396_14870, partial [Bradyrhizobium sp.]
LSAALLIALGLWMAAHQPERAARLICWHVLHFLAMVVTVLNATAYKTSIWPGGDQLSLPEYPVKGRPSRNHIGTCRRRSLPPCGAEWLINRLFR